MTRLYLFMICFLWGLLPSQAVSPDELKGMVIDADSRQPIAGVVIQALTKSGKALAFSSTSAEGKFSVKLSSAVDSISFRCMGYESYL